jgi:hypothetical protein
MAVGDGGGVGVIGGERDDRFATLAGENLRSGDAA